MAIESLMSPRGRGGHGRVVRNTIRITMGERSQSGRTAPVATLRIAEDLAEKFHIRYGSRWSIGWDPDNHTLVLSAAAGNAGIKFCRSGHNTKPFEGQIGGGMLKWGLSSHGVSLFAALLGGSSLEVPGNAMRCVDGALVISVPRPLSQRPK